MNRLLIVLSLTILLFISCSEMNKKTSNQENIVSVKLVTLEQLRQTKIYHKLDNLPENTDSVFSLNLSEQDLTKLPSEIFKLTNLQKLDISQNKLSNLKGIEELRNLQILNIGMNDFETFPNEITKLRNLKIINFYWNNIKSFPDDFYKKNILIEELDMSSMFEFDFENNLNKIHLFKNLRQLNLGNNQISDLTIQFGKLKNLEVFGYIRQEHIDLKKLCLELVNCKKLKTIHLSVNNIDVLPNEILLLENLEELNLYDNKINILPNDIVKMKNLKEISLIDNPINKQEIKKIEEQMPETKIIY